MIYLILPLIWLDLIKIMILQIHYLKLLLMLKTPLEKIGRFIEKNLIRILLLMILVGI